MTFICFCGQPYKQLRELVEHYQYRHIRPVRADARWGLYGKHRRTI